jgi:hypothetical protein
VFWDSGVLVGDKGDRIFRAGADAQAALVTLVGIHGICGHSPVRRAAELAQHPEGSEVADVHAAHCEDVVRADPDAVPLRFTTAVVNDGSGCHEHRIRVILRNVLLALLKAPRADVADARKRWPAEVMAFGAFGRREETTGHVAGSPELV